MAIHGYHGLPGKGKTAESTYFAIKHYRLMNGRINRYAANIINIKESSREFVEYHQSKNIKYNFINLVAFLIRDFVQHNRKFKLYPNNNVFSNYPIVLDPMIKFKQMFRFVRNSIHMLTEYQQSNIKKRFLLFIKIKYYFTLFAYLKNYFKDTTIWDYELKQFVKFDIDLIKSGLPVYGKYQIYSNVVQLTDLNMIYKFPKHSFIIFDEAQRYQDSRDFASFPKALGTFLQHHRHASIDDIIFVTQHPRRLDNKIRDLCEVFRKYRMFVKIPFLPFVFATYTNYYEFEDYGKFNQLPKEARTYDYDNHIQILPTSRTFDRYNSKYFSVIFEDLEDVQKYTFTGKGLTKTDIEKVGIKV